MPFLAIDIEGDGGEERLEPIGTDGRKDLPIRSTMLTAGQSDECLPLLLGGLFIDNGAHHAVALVYRTGPPDDLSETYAFQPAVTEISVVDLPCSSGFTLPGRRERIELAGTTPIAVAAHHLFTCDPPFDFRRFTHISLLLYLAE
jgi:hypothetical protein